MSTSCLTEEVSDYRHSGIPTRQPHEVADGLHVRRAGHSPRSREVTKEWEFLSIRVLSPEALYFIPMVGWKEVRNDSPRSQRTLE